MIEKFYVHNVQTMVEFHLTLANFGQPMSVNILLIAAL